MLNVIMGSELIWLELRDISLNVQGVNIRHMFYHQLIGHSERKLMVDDSLEKRIKVAHCRPRNVSIMWFFNPSLKLCGLRLPFQFKNQESRVKSQDPTNPLLHQPPPPLYPFFLTGTFLWLKNGLQKLLHGRLPTTIPSTAQLFFERFIFMYVYFADAALEFRYIAFVALNSVFAVNFVILSVIYQSWLAKRKNL